MNASAKSTHSRSWLSRLIVSLTIGLLMLSLFAASAFADRPSVATAVGGQRGTHHLDGRRPGHPRRGRRRRRRRRRRRGRRRRRRPAGDRYRARASTSGTGTIPVAALAMLLIAGLAGGAMTVAAKRELIATTPHTTAWTPPGRRGSMLGRQQTEAPGIPWDTRRRIPETPRGVDWTVRPRRAPGPRPRRPRPARPRPARRLPPSRVPRGTAARGRPPRGEVTIPTANVDAVAIENAWWIAVDDRRDERLHERLRTSAGSDARIAAPMSPTPRERLRAATARGERAADLRAAPRRTRATAGSRASATSRTPCP